MLLSYIIAINHTFEFFRFHMKIELGSSVVVSRSERTKNRAFLIACLSSDDHNAQKMIVFDSFQSARNPKYQ